MHTDPSPCGRRGPGWTPDERRAVNLRCIEEIDLEAIPVTHYDGRAH
ncbi:hypothetical protein [Burkholderia gladioli]|nr:hypothetical protein [Burkholderia gladioli]